MPADTSPFLRRHRRPLAILTAGALAPITLWTIVPLGAHGADQGQVQNRIDRSKALESSLKSSAARLERLESIAQKGIAVLEKRQAAAQAELDVAQGKLQRTQTKLDASRKKLADEKRRLDKDKVVLAANLRAAYQSGGTPDLATILVSSGNVGQFVDRINYVSSASNANARVLDNVRDARNQTNTLERSLQKIVPEQRREAAQVLAERNAIASRTAALSARKAALAQAHTARLQAIKATRSDRARAERTLKRLIAAQQKASVDKTGPGGPWAIPYAIVQCESGGQNLPPNFAGASGYYQFMPATWKAMGGSTSDAYKAGKAEQDRLAAKLWAGGSGARNWDCAAIVGLI
ncbi:MAG: transglycosylase family protein [Solirubrobacteraceae bacterium]|nr:transglycosylase family protein [Patulibacter sp.]